MNPPISDAAAEALREPGRLPVFVSTDGRRRRMLRLAGRVVAGLTAPWLIALLAGALGLGRLPGVSLPEVAAGEHADAPAAAPAKAHTASHSSSHRSAAGLSRHSHKGATSHRSAPAGPSRHGRAGGSLAPRPAGSGGSSTVRPHSQTSAPAPVNAPAPGSSPGHAPTAPRAHGGGGTQGGGQPAKTEPPGASRAQPSPTATEHSHRWTTDGG